jgi:crotonobetainyl-CoA:carnitine CoA-transferase CaiB-like acyl-CoA transferase
MYEVINRGKKSVAINYRNPRGRDVFLDLARVADGIVEGFRPGLVKKWRIDYETVRTVKPDIVYCSLSGYGQDGPYRNRAGHDLNYLSVGGAIDLNAHPGGPPIPYGLPVADLAGGMLAAIAILSALVGRKRSDSGSYLDIALLDGVLSWMTPLASAAYFGGIDVSAGTLPFQGGLPCFNVYQTADGKYIGLAAIEPKFWSAFCQVTERDDLLTRHFDRTVGDEIASLFQQRSREEWIQAFSDVDGCVEPVNSFDEMLQHPQVRARGYIVEQDRRPVGLNSPFVFARRVMSPAPRLGEHTREVLTEIGIKKDVLDDLAEHGIIGQ